MARSDKRDPWAKTGYTVDLWSFGTGGYRLPELRGSGSNTPSDGSGSEAEAAEGGGSPTARTPRSRPPQPVAKAKSAPRGGLLPDVPAKEEVCHWTGDYLHDDHAAVKGTGSRWVPRRARRQGPGQVWTAADRDLVVNKHKLITKVYGSGDDIELKQVLSAEDIAAKVEKAVIEDLTTMYFDNAGFLGEGSLAERVKGMVSGENASTFLEELRLQREVRMRISKANGLIYDMERLEQEDRENIAVVALQEGGLLSSRRNGGGGAVFSGASSMSRSAETSARMRQIRKMLQSLNWPTLHVELHKWLRKSGETEANVREFMKSFRAPSVEFEHVLDNGKDEITRLLATRDLTVVEQMDNFNRQLASAAEEYAALRAKEKAAAAPTAAGDTPGVPPQEDAAAAEAHRLHQERQKMNRLLERRKIEKRGDIRLAATRRAAIQYVDTTEAAPETPVESHTPRTPARTLKASPSASAPAPQEEGRQPVSPSKAGAATDSDAPAESDGPFDIDSLDEGRFGHLKQIYRKRVEQVMELRQAVHGHDKDLEKIRGEILMLLANQAEHTAREYISRASTIVQPSKASTNIVTPEIKQKVALKKERERLAAALREAEIKLAVRQRAEALANEVIPEEGDGGGGGGLSLWPATPSEPSSPMRPRSWREDGGASANFGSGGGDAPYRPPTVSFADTASPANNGGALGVGGGAGAGAASVLLQEQLAQLEEEARQLKDRARIMVQEVNQRGAEVGIPKVWSFDPQPGYVPFQVWFLTDGLRPIGDSPEALLAGFTAQALANAPVRNTIKDYPPPPSPQSAARLAAVTEAPRRSPDSDEAPQQAAPGTSEPGGRADAAPSPTGAVDASGAAAAARQPTEDAWSLRPGNVAVLSGHVGGLARPSFVKDGPAGLLQPSLQGRTTSGTLVAPPSTRDSEAPSHSPSPQPGTEPPARAPLAGPAAAAAPAAGATVAASLHEPPPPPPGGAVGAGGGTAAAATAATAPAGTWNTFGDPPPKPQNSGASEAAKDGGRPTAAQPQVYDPARTAEAARASKMAADLERRCTQAAELMQMKKKILETQQRIEAVRGPTPGGANQPAPIPVKVSTFTGGLGLPGAPMQHTSSKGGTLALGLPEEMLRSTAPTTVNPVVGVGQKQVPVSKPRIMAFPDAGEEGQEGGDGMGPTASSRSNRPALDISSIATGLQAGQWTALRASKREALHAAGTLKRERRVRGAVALPELVEQTEQSNRVLQRRRDEKYNHLKRTVVRLTGTRGAAVAIAGPGLELESEKQQRLQKEFHDAKEQLHRLTRMVDFWDARIKLREAKVVEERDKVEEDFGQSWEELVGTAFPLQNSNEMMAITNSYRNEGGGPAGGARTATFPEEREFDRNMRRPSAWRPKVWAGLVGDMLCIDGDSLMARSLVPKAFQQATQDLSKLEMDNKALEERRNSIFRRLSTARRASTASASGLLGKRLSVQVLGLMSPFASDAFGRRQSGLALAAAHRASRLNEETDIEFDDEELAVHRLLGTRLTRKDGGLAEALLPTKVASAVKLLGALARGELPVSMPVQSQARSVLHAYEQRTLMMSAMAAASGSPRTPNEQAREDMSILGEALGLRSEAQQLGQPWEALLHSPKEAMRHIGLAIQSMLSQDPRRRKDHRATQTKLGIVDFNALALVGGNSKGDAGSFGSKFQGWPVGRQVSKDRAPKRLRPKLFNYAAGILANRARRGLQRSQTSQGMFQLIMPLDFPDAAAAQEAESRRRARKRPLFGKRSRASDFASSPTPGAASEDSDKSPRRAAAAGGARGSVLGIMGRHRTHPDDGDMYDSDAVASVHTRARKMDRAWSSVSESKHRRQSFKDMRNFISAMELNDSRSESPASNSEDSPRASKRRQMRSKDAEDVHAELWANLESEESKLLREVCAAILRKHSNPVQAFKWLATGGSSGHKLTRSSLANGLATLGYDTEHANLIFRSACELAGLTDSVTRELSRSDFLALLRRTAPIGNLVDLRGLIVQRYGKLQVAFERHDHDGDGVLEPADFAALCASVGGSSSVARRLFGRMAEHNAEASTLPRLTLPAYLLSLRYAEGMEVLRRLRTEMNLRWQSVQDVFPQVSLSSYGRPLSLDGLRTALAPLGLSAAEAMGLHRLMSIGRRDGGGATMEEVVLHVLGGFGHLYRRMAVDLGFPQLVDAPSRGYQSGRSDASASEESPSPTLQGARTPSSRPRSERSSDQESNASSRSSRRSLRSVNSGLKRGSPTRRRLLTSACTSDVPSEATSAGLADAARLVRRRGRMRLRRLGADPAFRTLHGALEAICPLGFDPYAKLSEAEFVEVFGRQAHVDIDACEEIFQAVDAGGFGCISMSDCVRAARRLRPVRTLGHLRTLLKRRLARTKEITDPEEAFALADPLGTDQVSVDMWSRWLQRFGVVPSDARRLFELVDRSGSGVIAYEDFYREVWERRKAGRSGAGAFDEGWLATLRKHLERPAPLLLKRLQAAIGHKHQEELSAAHLLGICCTCGIVAAHAWNFFMLVSKQSTAVKTVTAAQCLAALQQLMQGEFGKLKGDGDASGGSASEASPPPSRRQPASRTGAASPWEREASPAVSHASRKHVSINPEPTVGVEPSFPSPRRSSGSEAEHGKAGPSPSSRDVGGASFARGRLARARLVPPGTLSKRPGGSAAADSLPGAAPALEVQAVKPPQRFSEFGGSTTEMQSALRCAQELRRKLLARARTATFGCVSAWATEAWQGLLKHRRADRGPGKDLDKSEFRAALTSSLQFPAADADRAFQVLEQAEGSGPLGLDKFIAGMRLLAPITSFLDLRRHLVHRFGSVPAALQHLQTADLGSAQRSAEDSAQEQFSVDELAARMAFGGGVPEESTRWLFRLLDVRQEGRLQWQDLEFGLENAAVYLQLQSLHASLMKSSKTLQAGLVKARVLADFRPASLQAAVDEEVLERLGLPASVVPGAQQVLARAADDQYQLLTIGTLIKQLKCFDGAPPSMIPPARAVEAKDAGKGGPPVEVEDVALQAWRRLYPELQQHFHKSATGLFACLDEAQTGSLSMSDWVERVQAADLQTKWSPAELQPLFILLSGANARPAGAPGGVGGPRASKEPKVTASDLARAIRLASRVATLQQLRSRLLEEFGSLPEAFEALNGGEQVTYEIWMRAMHRLWLTQAEAAQFFGALQAGSDSALSEAAFLRGLRAPDVTARVHDTCARLAAQHGIISRAFEGLDLKAILSPNDFQTSCAQLGLSVLEARAVHSHLLDERGSMQLADLLDAFTFVEDRHYRRMQAIRLLDVLGADELAQDVPRSIPPSREGPPPRAPDPPGWAGAAPAKLQPQQPPPQPQLQQPHPQQPQDGVALRLQLPKLEITNFGRRPPPIEPATPRSPAPDPPAAATSSRRPAGEGRSGLSIQGSEPPLAVGRGAPPTAAEPPLAVGRAPPAPPPAAAGGAKGGKGAGAAEQPRLSASLGNTGRATLGAASQPQPFVPLSLPAIVGGAAAGAPAQQPNSAREARGSSEADRAKRAREWREAAAKAQRGQSLFGPPGQDLLAQMRLDLTAGKAAKGAEAAAPSGGLVLPPLGKGSLTARELKPSKSQLLG